MWREALDAAEYTLMRWETHADRLVGRPVRLALGRYAAVLFLGWPLAWALNSFHWGSPAKWGLIWGLLLYALIDFCKLLWLKPRLKP
jgi:hypothetical protein